MLFGSLIFMFTLSWKLSMITLINIPIIFFVNKIFGTWYDELGEVWNGLMQAVGASRKVFEFIDRPPRVENTSSGGQKQIIAIARALVRQPVVLLLDEATSELDAESEHTVQEAISKNLMGKTVILIAHRLSTVENADKIVVINKELGEVWNGLMQAVGASRKVFEFIDRPPRVENTGTYAPDSMTGKIEFRHVAFSYPIRPDLPIMEDLTFTVEPGEVVALVGPSGGGKSSCIAMLEHFYEPTSGEVLIDGVPVREYDHKFLHTKVALVGQEPVLYARSVTENIGYGLDKYDDDMVQKSAKLANAHTFIMNDTTDGYNTNVGEKGSQMSGGQKQRIAIARALVRQPVVLLLDEATSALDAESEHTVQEAISKNLKGKTVILIAHRLSTVENADKIVVINKGKVEQLGNHKTLMEQEGLYKQLVQRQMMSGEDGLDDEIEEVEPIRDGAGSGRSTRAGARRIRSPSQSISQSFLGTSFASSYL